MSTLDVNFGYNEIKLKVEAAKGYTDVKKQYDSVVKKAGNSFDQSKSNVSEQFDKVKEQQKRFQREIKTQFDQLLDINNVTGSNSVKYLKKLFITSLKNIEPKIAEILYENSISALGCDQQQTYLPQEIYIKVKSTDLFRLLKKDPSSENGKILYEKKDIDIYDIPFSMNKELYHRIQNGQSYLTEYGQNYRGFSGQDLFDIQYTETNNLGETGNWFKITLYNRTNNINKVGEFLIDYYRTISIVDFNNVLTYIMEALCGVVSMNENASTQQIEDTTKFMLIINRILGLCFDNVTEIDVSGISKIAELDEIDESFFEFTDIDLRTIENRISNIKNGVVEFEGCDNIKIPVDFYSIINGLNTLNFVADSDLVDSANSITDILANNPEWNGITINFPTAIDLNFIKLIVHGIVSSLFSPKILLPILIMYKSLQQNFADDINSLMDFIRHFRRYFINVVSKIGALFVKELFELIKKDILRILQTIISDITKEKIDKKVIMILKLIQLLLIVSQFISDWRKCKSVIDEILWLLKVATSGWGGEVPLPLLFASQLLDGYSETRAFIGVIEELQRLGIPTGPMPDGSPNLEILKMFGQMKAMAKEDSENGKVQIAIGPLAMTPAGLTIPTSAFGKKF